jgi:hypothetical protein
MCSACLRNLPTAPASAEDLASLILANLPSTKKICISVTALSKLIRQWSGEDFAKGRIVLVDNWMLSLTETRVYAFASLIGHAAV